MMGDHACESYDEPGRDCITSGPQVIAAEGMCGPCASRLVNDDLKTAILKHCAEESYEFLRVRPRPWWRLWTEKPSPREAYVRFKAAEKVRAIVMDYPDCHKELKP